MGEDGEMEKEKIILKTFHPFPDFPISS